LDEKEFNRIPNLEIENWAKQQLNQPQKGMSEKGSAGGSIGYQ
jgi:hypothetical protein